MSGMAFDSNLNVQELGVIKKAVNAGSIHALKLEEVVNRRNSVLLPRGLDPSSPRDPRYETPPMDVQLKEQFKWGGSNSGRTVRGSLGDGFHTVDKFPPELHLLAHNEILYQRILPKRMMIHYRQVSGEGKGGRTFVHSAENMERLILNEGAEGKSLVGKLKEYRQLIRTGFLDANHPEKEENFVRSWQDRFQTEDIDIALDRCRNQKSHFDKCWKVELDKVDSNGQRTFMLMTEITIPMFKEDERNRKSYMMFPRIAYDGPELKNGMREFLIGNGGKSLSSFQKKGLRDRSILKKLGSKRCQRRQVNYQVG